MFQVCDLSPPFFVPIPPSLISGLDCKACSRKSEILKERLVGCAEAARLCESGAGVIERELGERCGAHLWLSRLLPLSYSAV